MKMKSGHCKADLGHTGLTDTGAVVAQVAAVVQVAAVTQCTVGGGSWCRQSQ